MKPLIVYYSWSGTTEKAAKRLAKATDGDLVKLEPEKAYPSSYGMTALKSLVEQLSDAGLQLFGTIRFYRQAGLWFLYAWWQRAKQKFRNHAEGLQNRNSCGVCRGKLSDRTKNQRMALTEVP